MKTVFYFLSSSYSIITNPTPRGVLPSVALPELSIRESAFADTRTDITSGIVTDITSVAVVVTSTVASIGVGNVILSTRDLLYDLTIIFINLLDRENY